MGSSASKEQALASPLAKSWTEPASTKQTSEMGNSPTEDEIPLPYPRAGLLGLPPELRLMIYDLMKDSDIQCHLTKKKWQYFPDSPPRLPLQDLARTCNLLALEIRHHRHALPASERYATISIRATRQGTHVCLSHASWPATDLAVFNLVYDIAISRHPARTRVETVFKEIELYFVKFPGFYRLPAATRVQAFCQVRLDRSDMPSEEQYLRDVEDVREGLERAHGAKCTAWEGLL